MSIFDNNITTDLSESEKINYWFSEKIRKTFSEFTKEYQAPKHILLSKKWQPSRVLYEKLVHLWVEQYRTDLREMHVFHTYTDVIQPEPGANCFRVIIHYHHRENKEEARSDCWVANGVVELDNLSI